jgi:hypothetical protein
MMDEHIARIKDFENQLHRTWVQLLIETNQGYVASIAVDSEITLRYSTTRKAYDDDGMFERWADVVEVTISIPVSFYELVRDNPIIKSIMEPSLASILLNRWTPLEANDGYGIYREVKAEQLDFMYSVMFLKVEAGWQDKVRMLITTSGVTNQGVITEKVFTRDQKTIIEYNEMKFGSRSEVRIAQALERRKVLFFPLPLAVRAETGVNYQDRREVDFLVCNDGIWGILEVAHHEGRYEKDSEKAGWFKKSGLLCVEFYTAERCYGEPEKVVDEFLSILARYKRY